MARLSWITFLVFDQGVDAFFMAYLKFLISRDSSYGRLKSRKYMEGMNLYVMNEVIIKLGYLCLTRGKLNYDHLNISKSLLMLNGPFIRI